jgi:hypothetical protein
MKLLELANLSKIQAHRSRTLIWRMHDSGALVQSDNWVVWYKPGAGFLRTYRQDHVLVRV